MIELEKQDYPKARGSLKNVTINSLFARAVIERHISGTVYADNKDKPTTFYVVHPYGMSLLFGNHKNSEFNSAVKDYALNKNGSRNGFEWMQAFPNDWHNVIKELFKENLINSSENKNNLTAGFIELNTRVNFEFDLDKYFNFRENLNPTNGTITNTTKDIFNSMQGSVVPSNFWNNADDFLNNGVGFSLFSDGQLACTAFSSFLMDNMLELGMETIPKYREKGFAQQTCCRLIDYCLDNDYKPIWACRLENIGSVHLARKLGFEPTIQIPYYRLSD